MFRTYKTTCGEKNLAIAIAKATLLIILLQGVRFALEYFILPLLPTGTFHDQMLNMCITIVLTTYFLIFVGDSGIDINLMPERFNKYYAAATVVAVGCVLATPVIYIEGLSGLMIVFYGCVITPVFEELVFRGYITKKFEETGLDDWIIFFTVMMLFTVWQLGYMIPSMIAGNWKAVLFKLLTGLCYGAVLGLARMKFRNCYVTILLHAVLNVFII